MSKRLKIFFVALLLGFIVLYFYKKYRVAPSFPLADQEIVDVAGNKMKLNEVLSKPAIVSFYASWCGDCIKELNELQEIYRTDLPDVNIICITDESPEKIASFKQKHSYDFQFYHINKTFDELSIHAIPVTYLTNSKGVVKYNKVGRVKWKDESFLQFAKAQLTDR